MLEMTIYITCKTRSSESEACNAYLKSLYLFTSWIKVTLNYNILIDWCLTPNFSSISAHV